jgi:serine/threonine protein phosphatase PrpC
MAKNYFGITDTGKMRKNNEDTFIAQAVLNDRFIAACVIDGVGGYEGGEVAARIAHDAIIDTLKNSSDDILNTMVDAFAAANQRIYNERQVNKENDQMACVLTLALVDIANNKFYYTHVGDTRLYLFRDSLVKVSHDHSFVGFLEDNGKLTEEAAMRHPKRNEINKALGFDSQINSKDYIETGESPFLPGDMLLLCSDGLTDMVNNSAITDILTSKKSLAEKGKALVDAANDAGGKDNITVVLVVNDKTPTKQQATKPVASAKKEADVIEKISDTKSVAASAPVVEKKKGSSVPVLTFLCILFLATTLWLIYKTYGAKEARPDSGKQQENISKRQRNEQEQNFINSINTTNKEIFLSDSTNGKRIVITDSILIQSDSLHIFGNGTTFSSDSAFTGPAFVISPTCNYLLLDSVTFENFDIGILLQNEVLHFKNVQFRNCRVPIQYQYLFPNNTILNGRISDSIYHNNTDSL